jgi:hypothetical protein
VDLFDLPVGRWLARRWPGLDPPSYRDDPTLCSFDPSSSASAADRWIAAAAAAGSASMTGSGFASAAVSDSGASGASDGAALVRARPSWLASVLTADEFESLRVLDAWGPQ